MAARRKAKPGLGRDGAFYKSGFERQVANAIREVGVDPNYELTRFDYTLSYLPDFFPCRRSDGERVIMEAKGYFPPEDRAKILVVLRSNPKLRDRFVIVFQNPQAKASKTLTYAQWANKNNIRHTTVDGLRELLQ